MVNVSSVEPVPAVRVSFTLPLSSPMSVAVTASPNASLAANDKPDAPPVTEPITPLVSHNGVPILIVGTTLSADTSNTSASPTYLFMSGSVTV